MTPSSPLPLLWLLAMSASCLALYSVAHVGGASQHWLLLLFFAAMVVGDVVPLVRPDLWTPEVGLIRESTTAVLAVATAFRVGARAFVGAQRAWQSTCRLAFAALVPLVLVGTYGLGEAVTRRSGYRGLFVVDAAVVGVTSALVIGRAWYELGESGFDSAVLRALLVYYGARCLYVGSWEVVPVGAAEALGVLETCVYVWATLVISAAAWRTRALRRGRQ